MALRRSILFSTLSLSSPSLQEKKGKNALVEDIFVVVVVVVIVTVVCCQSDPRQYCDFRPPHERLELRRLGDENDESFREASVRLSMEVDEVREQAQEAEDNANVLKRKLEDEEDEKRELQQRLKKEEGRASRNEEKLKKVRIEKKKEHDLLMYQRTKTQEAREKAEVAEDIESVEAELEEERRKNRSLVAEIEMLRGVVREQEEEIEKLEESQEETVTLMEGRQYKPEVVEWIWQLIQCNVAHHQVPKVIESSLKFFGKKADQIPTVKTINNLNISSLAASQQHLKVGHVFFRQFVPPTLWSKIGKNTDKIAI